MNQIEDSIRRAAGDLMNSKYSVALTGAGISTESGVPDFRGPNGIWTRDPEAERRAYQTYSKFVSDPGEYWKDRISSPSLLGDLERLHPNPGHYALAELESMGLLKCIITQNVDNFHSRAGSKNVLEYHGNAFKLRCVSCNARYNYDEYDLIQLREEAKLPPHCRKCGGLLKDDVVHFNEPIPSDVASQSLEEAGKCDLMLICGTSAVVYPFAQLPRVVSTSVTIIEINAEPTQLTLQKVSDYLIQGKTGEVLPLIVEQIKRIRK